MITEISTLESNINPLANIVKQSLKSFACSPPFQWFLIAPKRISRTKCFLSCGLWLPLSSYAFTGQHDPATLVLSQFL